MQHDTATYASFLSAGLSDGLPHFLHDIGIYASLICAFFSGWLAQKYLKESPRLFTVLSLFALIWALLAIFWDIDNVKLQITDTKLQEKMENIRDAMSVYASFLLVYIGGLLDAHAAEPTNIRRFHIVDKFQFCAVYLLLFVITGKTLLFSISEMKLIELNHTKITVLADQVLFLFGGISILFGMKKLSNSTAWYILALTLVVYISLKIGYRLPVFKEELGDLSAYNLASSSYPYLFAAIKSILALVFGCMVAYAGMSEEQRRSVVWRDIGRLM